MGDRLLLSSLPGVVRGDVRQGRRYPLQSFVTLRRVTVTRAAHSSPARADLRSAAPDAHTSSPAIQAGLLLAVAAGSAVTR